MAGPVTRRKTTSVTRIAGILKIIITTGGMVAIGRRIQGRLPFFWVTARSVGVPLRLLGPE